jgi:hypothetical protein
VSAQSLRDAQRWFLSAISHGESLEEGVAVAARETTGGALDAHVTPGPRMSSRDRLAIYHHAYRARLVECLADDYGALRFALEEEPFEKLAHEYIAEIPSRSFSLNFYGKRMPEFVRSRTEEWARFGADLAALEWAIVEAIHAPDPSAQLAEKLRALAPEDWESVRFSPSPTLTIVRSDFPVNDFFQAFRDEQSPKIPSEEKSATAVYRKGMSIWRRALSQPMEKLLSSILSGEALGEALSKADATEDEVSAWFGEWMSDGYFGDVSKGS